MIRLIILMTLACTGCSTTIDHQGFVVVTGTKSIEKINPNRADNVYPWIRLEAVKNKDEILVSNSCGFAHLIYEQPHDAERDEIELFSTKVWDGFESMGEWCRIRELVVDSDTLILFRAWRGKNYVLNKTPIFTDGKGERFIALRNFIESSDLSRLSEKIREPETGTGCYDSNDYWYDRVSRLGTVFDTKGKRCFLDGVYIKSLRQAGDTRLID